VPIASEQVFIGTACLGVGPKFVACFHSLLQDFMKSVEDSRCFGGCGRANLLEYDSSL
jgi:hypothetical protein